MWTSFALAAVLSLSPALAAAQSSAPEKPLFVEKSHEVHADGSVTFRLASRNAHNVLLLMDTLKQPLPLTNDGNGLWSVTTPALQPQIYNYSFLVDGVHTADTRNAQVHRSFADIESLVTVPGTPAQPWEQNTLPHGALTLERFTTHVALNLPDQQSEYVVYTPAGYDAKKKGGYPVLYLLHGYLDSATAWTEVGRAQNVLDTMIANKQCLPMVVVMPLGYGDWSFLTGGFSNWNDPAKVDANVNLFEQSLETEVMPAVEKSYNIASGREHHAISGLSMGGLETLRIGLTHADQFAYVAGMSSAIHNESFDQHYGSIDPKKANLKLLWVGVGVDDHLLKPNRDFVAWAKARGFNVQAVETPGAHQWPVWRENLVTILPLLFR
ncbi:MAG: alpha/beta hydrolase-fold protein [Acidobacteriaceae bacterium]|nr:alpha/beta hydrolase-fold protein [Acidobacteriaceae bacterium]